MLIRFTTLTIKNFLSYGAVPTIINLDNPGTTLIVGEDLDNTASGVGANGVGKTVILNALVYALYDKPISNISKDNLVNNINKKNMEVTLEFEKDGNKYRVVRARKQKAGAAGNWVHLFINGEDKTLDSAANTNEQIEQIIGIPYDLFIRIVAGSATQTPFLSLKVRHPTEPNQTDIIEELFDLKTLSEKAVLLKKEISAAESSLKIQRVRVEQLEKEHARHEKQLESAQRRVDVWQENNDKEIASIQRKLKRFKGIDVDEQQSLIDQIRALDEQMNNNSLGDIKREIKELLKAKKDAENELTHLDDEKCPYCKQKLTDVAAKIKSCKSTITKSENRLEKLTHAATKIDEELTKLQEQREELEPRVTVKQNELTEIRTKSATYEQQLETLQKANNPFIEPLEELQEVELDPIEMDEINELVSLIDHQKFLLKLLTKKDSFVRKALLNKNIPFLNQRLAHYLKDLGLPHTVEFTHEMTASITQFGRPLDFGNLSNGQQARVNLALSFAFRDVLQSLHSRINVCMLDEVLDVGLDAVGVRLAAKMLKRKARDENLSLYIISHVSEIDSAFDRKLTVQMSKGFSYVIKDE